MVSFACSINSMSFLLMALCCHPGLMVYCTAICLYAKIMITKCNCETGCFAIESGLGIGPWIWMAARKKAPQPMCDALCLAETEGVEPSMQFFTTCSLSRGVPSATRSRFLKPGLYSGNYRVKKLVIPALVEKLAWAEGVEPSTFGFGDQCSAS